MYPGTEDALMQTFHNKLTEVLDEIVEFVSKRTGRSKAHTDPLFKVWQSKAAECGAGL